MARSKTIASHIGRLSRSKVKAYRGLQNGLKKSDAPVKSEPEPFKEVQVGGDKNGGKRLVPTSKAAAFYPAEDIRQPKKSRKTPQPTKLRASITPGTVLILLAGRFRGRRVVFLKQLSSGLLLITGPYGINGVPLRRVNQAYVIATSTNVDLGEFNELDDAYFVKSSKPRSRDAESEFFENGKPKAKEAYPEAKSVEQKKVDKVIIEAVKKTENLGKYLKASWGLKNGQHPHQLVF
ncbi:ribosomal protein L6e-domain-containing protein [Hysterangium stoloniferum]|nr:ribosomal protein L6e-domain-containing protein [Hysterangium stoloniferum]